MKRINEFINEKLKISKNYRNDTMQVPSEIDTVHQRYLNKLYDIIQRKVVREKIDEDENFWKNVILNSSSIEFLQLEHLPCNFT